MGCVECSTNNAGVALLGVADFTNLFAVEALTTLGTISFLL
jgi:hypothetical protein